MASSSSMVADNGDEWRGMEEGLVTTETHRIHAHGTTWIDAVYTNDVETVDSVLAMYEEWLAEEKNRFIGFDLEYDGTQRDIAVIKIALRNHVLIFQIIRAKGRSSRLRNFLEDKEITFASVDTRKDKRGCLLRTSWTFDWSTMWTSKIFSRLKEKSNRAGMADLAALLIDPKFSEMKTSFTHDFWKREGHNFWAWKPLAKKNLEYAALDGYVAYELYRRIKIVNEGQRHLQPKPTEAICQRCKDNDGFSSSKRRKVS